MNEEKTETHILIVWPKSMPYYSEILEKISEEFVLEELRTVYINPLSIGWLKDFYARSLAHFNKKETKKIIKTYKL